jgi:outer membrane lipoprotein carrier protein
MKKMILLMLPLWIFALNIDFDSFSADFTQTVTNEYKKKIVYSGSLLVKKPDKAYWNYKKPIKKEVFINSGEVIVYEPELLQAVVMHKKNLPNIVEILKGAKELEGGKYRAMSGQKEMIFTMASGIPERITYKDDMDNSVEIVFKNVKKNFPAPSSLFEFKAPANIDVVKE